MMRTAGKRRGAKLRTRMIISMAVVFALFIVALAAALTGMQSARSRFEHYVNIDQERLLAGTGMYAQGLQIGQALRNIVMDPQNKQAYKNLEEADKAFRQSAEMALSLSQDDAAARTLLQEVVALRDRQKPIHARVVEAAATDQAAAIGLIRTEETPVWREMRTRLQDFIKEQRTVAGDIKADTMAFTRNALLISVCLGIVAVLAGAGLMTWLTVRVMKQLGGEPDYAVRIAQDIAAGDLTGKISLRTGDTSSLLYSMRSMQEQLGLTLENIRHVAESISGASREIATGNADLSSRTESQAASLEETASSMQQLTGTVRMNSESAHEASRLASEASGVAARGGDMVGRVVDTMQAIKAGSSRIADIIGVIDGIAFQTNILALNAAVEAARAGEQGRGFAVVAGEVRTLAQRSAAAAREIKELVGESVGNVEEGSRLVDATGKTMSEIVDAIGRVTHIMQGIARASEEQATGIEQVNQAVTQMDDTTQQNAALVEQAAAAAQSMQDQAVVLMQAVDRFRLGTPSTAHLLPADEDRPPEPALPAASRTVLRLT